VLREEERYVPGGLTRAMGHRHRPKAMTPLGLGRESLPSWRMMAGRGGWT